MHAKPRGSIFDSTVPTPDSSQGLVNLVKNTSSEGVWVDQSIEHPALDFGSGHDLTVHGMEPRVGLCTDSMQPAWECLSLSLSLSLFPSLSQNK